MAQIHVEADGKRLDLSLATGDIMRFERKFGVTLAELVVEPGEPVKAGHLEMMLYLAWCSARRTKQTDVEFDDWVDTITDVGAVEADPLDRPNAS